MPELPEIEVLKENLLSQIKGKGIKQFQVLKPYILKSYVEGDLCDEKIKTVERKGKFLLITLSNHKLVIHLMLRGVVRYCSSSSDKIKKSVAALIRFKDGALLEMSERSSKKRMSVYVLKKDESLRKIEVLGIDPFDHGFSSKKLKDLLYSESRQLKSFLRRQSKIAGIGNAYADEILWHAQLSPFKITTNMNDEEIKKFYKAIRYVLEKAITIIRKEGISEKKDFLKIHGKKGKPCPRCGGSIEAVSFSSIETSYCPKCQTKGKKLRDRRMSKFYR